MTLPDSNMELNIIREYAQQDNELLTRNIGVRFAVNCYANLCIAYRLLHFIITMH